MNVGAIGNVLTFSRTALSGGDNVTLTVTPTGGAGTCFTAASATCTATACTPPTASISYGGPFCSSIATQQAVTLTGTGAFTGGAYSSTTGLSLNTATGAITPSTSTAGTYTVTYTIAAGGGCPGVIATTSVKIDAEVIPTFSAVSPICSGATLAALPTTSLNGITGTWSPALNNTATTTYTFTPSAGQCAATASLTITVNPILSPTINCGVSTSSSVSFNWAAVTGATGYTVAYKINAGPLGECWRNRKCADLFWTALSGGDNVTLTVTPTGGAGTCFTAASATCTATACTPPTASISYGGPFCSSIATQQAVTLTGTGAFTGGTYSSATGLSLNTTTGAIMPSTSTAGTYTVTYTIAAGGGCPGVMATTSVKIDAEVIPTFTAVSPICSGAALAALPTTSLNGITGTWSPALNNTATTTYTFTPSTGQCATTASLSITVNPNVTPTFTTVAPICSGATLAALPTTSLNGITGTWSPALNNTATTTYTFTPSAGQCATTANLTITVNPILSPTINCGVSTSSSVSFNWVAVTGATGYTVAYKVNAGPLVNVGAIGNVLTYSRTALSGGDDVTLTVTPTGGTGTCFSAASATCTATACTPPTASISYGGPFCSSITTQQAVTLTGTGAFTGGTYSSTTGLSLNTATGAITPSTSTAGTYTVTYTIAAGGGCPGVIATTSVKIDAEVIPTFSAVSPICSGATLAALPTTSLNGITGTWSPALNNTATTTYTFTPSAGQCAATASLTITVNPIPAMPAANISQPTCADPTGTFILTSSTTNLTFSLDGTAYFPYPANGFKVPGGSHTLSAKNSLGCISAPLNLVVNNAPLPPTAVETSVTPAACGNNNGTLIIGKITGGTPPYMYSINNGAPAGALVYSNLAAGTYILLVSDANLCTFDTSFIITNTGGASVTTTFASAYCGGNNGTITATGFGGTPPYQYALNGGAYQASDVFAKLFSGNYAVTIKDANNCTQTVQVTVSDSTAITVTAGAGFAICEGDLQKLGSHFKRNVIFMVARRRFK